MWNSPRTTLDGGSWKRSYPRRRPRQSGRPDRRGLRGHENEPAQDFPANAHISLAKYSDFVGPPHPDAPDRRYELTLSGGMMMMSMGSNAWTINGRSYPDTSP